MIFREVYVVGVGEEELTYLQMRSAFYFFWGVEGKKGFLKGN